jgi:hypothetical protein
MMTVRRSENRNVNNFQKIFFKVCHYVALFQEFVDTLVNGRPSLFRVDRVHQMEASLSHY